MSRYRELAADRGGALLTGNPAGLARALQKISGEMGQIPTKDLRAMEPVSAFAIAPALNGREKTDLSALFSTHPPLEQRLENLARIANQLDLTMGFFDSVLGRTKPVKPDLDVVQAAECGAEP